MKKTIIALIGLVCMFFTVFQTATVRAHQPFNVGPYHIEIGWAVEPTVTWQQNAVEVKVTNSTDNTGIVGLVNNLTITLYYASQQRPFRGAAGRIVNTDIDGVYHVPVILTEPGSYNATLTGTIGHTPIDLKAVPDRFERVVDGYDSSNPNGILFPGPARSPSQLEAAAADASRRADNAMIIADAGVAVGIVGILVGAIALLHGRSPRVLR